MQSVFNLDGPIMSVLSRLCDLVWLNILTIICCIPIITIGPAVTALHYMTMKMVRGEEGYITQGYFKSFRENWKQSAILGIIIGSLIIVLIIDYMILFTMESSISSYIFIAMLAVTFFLLMTSIYIYPLQARFVNTCKGTIKNAFILSITQLPKTIIMMVTYVLPAAVMYYIPYLTPVVFLVGFALPVYLNSYWTVGIFKKLEIAQFGEEEQEEEKEWIQDEEEIDIK